jgi:anti-sigma factor RsiW
MSACRRAVPLLETFVDGELSADKVVEVEQHLLECSCCRERVQLTHALQVSTRRAVRADAEPSPEFQARLLRALSAERERESLAAQERERSKPLSWRVIVPMAAAAGFTLVWGAASNNNDPDRPSASRGTEHASLAGAPESAPMTDSVDRLIEQLVDYHASATLPEVTEPSMIGNLEPEVGVPVQVPSLKQYGARWEGASVVPVRVAPKNLRAASLRYRLGGHRVTLYVYDSSRFPLRATLEPRVVRNMPVYVGTRRGYSIAAVERRGLGWAVATDLTDRESAELVAASAH